MTLVNPTEWRQRLEASPAVVLNSHGPKVNAAHVTLLELRLWRIRFFCGTTNRPHDANTGEYNQADDRGKKHKNFGQCQSRVNESHASAVDFEAGDGTCLLHNIRDDNDFIRWVSQCHSAQASCEM